MHQSSSSSNRGRGNYNNSSSSSSSKYHGEQRPPNKRPYNDRSSGFDDVKEGEMRSHHHTASNEGFYRSAKPARKRSRSQEGDWKNAQVHQYHPTPSSTAAFRGGNRGPSTLTTTGGATSSSTRGGFYENNSGGNDRPAYGEQRAFRNAPTNEYRRGGEGERRGEARQAGKESTEFVYNKQLLSARTVDELVSLLFDFNLNNVNYVNLATMFSQLGKYKQADYYKGNKNKLSQALIILSSLCVKQANEFDAQAISNVINGITRSELFSFDKNLLDLIKHLVVVRLLESKDIDQFNGQNLSLIVNGVSKIPFFQEEEIFQRLFLVVADEIAGRKRLDGFEAQTYSMTLNAFSKLGDLRPYERMFVRLRSELLRVNVAYFEIQSLSMIVNAYGKVAENGIGSEGDEESVLFNQLENAITALLQNPDVSRKISAQHLSMIAFGFSKCQNAYSNLFKWLARVIEERSRSGLFEFSYVGIANICTAYASLPNGGEYLSILFLFAKEIVKRNSMKDFKPLHSSRVLNCIATPDMLSKYGTNEVIGDLLRLIFEDYLNSGMSELVFSEHERPLRAALNSAEFLCNYQLNDTRPYLELGSKMITAFVSFMQNKETRNKFRDIQLSILATIFAKYSYYQGDDAGEDWQVIFNLFFKEFTGKEVLDVMILHTVLDCLVGIHKDRVSYIVLSSSSSSKNYLVEFLNHPRLREGYNYSSWKEEFIPICEFFENECKFRKIPSFPVVLQILRLTQYRIFLLRSLAENIINKAANMSFNIAGRELKVPLAFGTMMWGTTKFDEYLGGHRGVLKDSVVKEMLDEAKMQQVELFDSAEGYGDGTSEDRIGRLVAVNDQPSFIVATKYLPMFWRMTQQQFDDSLEASRARLNVKVIDLYLLHTPMHWLGLEFHVKCLARAKQDGRVRSIGISNCDAEQVLRTIECIKPVKLDCIQIHVSLLCYASKNLQKCIEVCKENNILILGFSPVAQGLLVDDLTDEKFKASRIGKVTKLKQDELLPLRTAIKEIASKHHCTMAQVAIAWSAHNKIVPLVGVRTVKQVKEAVDAVKKIHLSAGEMEKLNNLSLALSTFEKPKWQRVK